MSLVSRLVAVSASKGCTQLMNSGKHVAMQRPALPRRFLNSFAWLGFVALLSWLTLAYVGRAYAVPSGSME